MNVTSDREEGIRMLRLILGGKGWPWRVRWAWNGLRITAGVTLREQRADLVRQFAARFELAAWHGGNGWFAHNPGIAALARNRLVMNPRIRFFDPAAQGRVWLPP